jgi:hypothetical protein
LDTIDIDFCLTQLEDTCDKVIAVILQNKTDSLEQLVVEQCQWLKRFGAIELDDDSKNRLALISDKVKTQQLLIGQALQISEFFMTRLHEARGFNKTG